MAAIKKNKNLSRRFNLASPATIRIVNRYSPTLF
jgi:hypothetical protein